MRHDRVIGLDRPGEVHMENSGEEDWSDSETYSSRSSSSSSDDEIDSSASAGSGLSLRNMVARISITSDLSAAYGIWLDMSLPGTVAKLSYDLMMAAVQSSQENAAYRLVGEESTVKMLWRLAAALVALAVDGGAAAKCHAAVGRCLVALDAYVADAVKYMMIAVFDDAFAAYRCHHDPCISVGKDLTVKDAPDAEGTLTAVARHVLMHSPQHV